MKQNQKIRILVILLLSLAVLGFSALAYLQWVGRPVHTEIPLSVIAEGENAPSRTLVLRLDGRLKLRLFSYAAQQFEGTAVIPGLYEPASPPVLYAAMYPDRSGSIAGSAFSDTPFPFQSVFYWDGHTGLLLLPADTDLDPDRMTFYVTEGHTRAEALETWFGP